jgi:hypothetical protein
MAPTKKPKPKKQPIAASYTNTKYPKVTLQKNKSQAQKNKEAKIVSGIVTAASVVPAVRGARVAATVLGSKATVAKAVRATKSSVKPGATVKGASKLTERAANSVKHPGGRFIDKRTGAVYDSNYNILSPGRKSAVAKQAVKKVAKNVKNSPAAADVKNKNLKNYKKKFGK